MKNRKLLAHIAGIAVLASTSFYPAQAVTPSSVNDKQAGNLNIGWAEASITPSEPVPLAGMATARISQGVMDPIGTTVLVLEKAGSGPGRDMAVLVSLDLCFFLGELQERVRFLVKEAVPEIDTRKIVFSATHTHDAPEIRTSRPDLARKLAGYGLDIPMEWSQWGIDLGVMTPAAYVEFASGRIAGAIEQAWNGRKPGGISFGLEHAVIGHNRLAVYYDGRSQMYGSTNHPDFSHIEGYEDHSVNVIYTWNSDRKLTGMVINSAIPSQAGGSRGRISADFWYETRIEIARRLGEGLFVLPQCSAGGDQSPRVMIGHQAEARMEQITGRTRREQIAVRLADAVTSILPFMQKNIDWDPVLRHRVENVELTRRQLSEDDIRLPRRSHHSREIESVEQAFERLLAEYRQMLSELEDKPEMRQEPNWYRPITGIYWRLARASTVVDRYELQKTQPKVPFEIHVIRIGDMAVATNPFELHLDFGMQMRARSKAVQTFLVQLAGAPYAAYLPPSRGVEGGAYGAIVESTEIGPEGGRELVGHTIRMIESLWD